MALLVSAFLSLIIIAMVFLAIRIIRINGESTIFQFAFLAALSSAVLAFLEIQIIQSDNYEVIQSFDKVYSLNTILIQYFTFSSALAFVNPFQKYAHKWIIKYKYFICAIPLGFLFFQLGFNQVALDYGFIYKNGLWFFSFNHHTITAKIYLAYFSIGSLLMAYCFWLKLKAIKWNRDMFDKKLILLIMAILPITSVFYFLAYSNTQQVPFMASIPISFCVIALSWTYADFNIFQINSKVALEEILESMANSMVITDRNCNIVEINSEGKKILGKRNKCLIGVNLLDLLNKGKIKNWGQIVSSFLENPDEAHSGELMIEGKKRSRFFHFTINPVYSKTNRKNGFLFLALDRTDEMQNKASILKHTRELQKSNLELERFAYIASHDLKTPLRSVVSFLDLIERRIVKYNDPELKEFTYHARQGASQMYHLIQDVLEYSKVNNDKIENGVVDINDTMLAICKNLKPQMCEKNAEIMVYNMPQIVGEQKHMTQLFGSLIENGIKYNNDSLPSIKINHRQENAQHIFAISDNGIGIEKKYFQQIFQMFKRLHTTSNYDGSGIGLSICKKIIDLYQGEIWLESKPKEGSVFFFTLSMN